MSTKNEPRPIIFQGNAAPFGARIYSINDKPFHDLVPGPPSSSLSVEGGWSRSESNGSAYRDIFRWGPTLADCRGELRTDGNPVTTVISSVEDFVALNKPHRFEAGRLRVGMVSVLGPVGQASIVPTQVAFDDLRVDGDLIEVGFDHDLTKFPTLAEFEAEYQSKEAFREKYKHCLRNSGQPGTELPRMPGGKIGLSFVHALRWRGQDYPTNVLEVEDFGKIYFGEVLMSENARTVTMVRLVLGCNVGGSGTVAQSDPGVNWGT
jgi:hypothetical protein